MDSVMGFRGRMSREQRSCKILTVLRPMVLLIGRKVEAPPKLSSNQGHVCGDLSHAQWKPLFFKLSFLLQLKTSTQLYYTATTPSAVELNFASEELNFASEELNYPFTKIRASEEP